MTIYSTGLLSTDLNRLSFGRRTHFDHYRRKPLPFACISAKGLDLDLVDLGSDRTGERFTVMDASGGYGSACLGAGHPVVKRALHRAVEEVGYVTDEIGSLERATLLDELFGENGLWRAQFPDDRYRVSGRNSGSEGMELALRLVLESRFNSRRLRRVKGREQRDTILAFEGAWHGWTAGLVPLLNRRHYRIGLPQLQSDNDYGIRIEHIPFGDEEALRDYFTKNSERLLAVIIEPIQGDAGILLPPPCYLRTVANLCSSEQVLLVADEVLTFAKSGRFFAMTDEQGPIHTDITVIGKSLGMSVVSTSMVIVRRELEIRSSGAVATSDLRPLVCAVIREGISYFINERLLEHSVELGKMLSKTLHGELVERFPDVYRETRGVGVIHGIELTEAAAARLDELRVSLIRNGTYVEFMAGAGKRSHGLRYVYPTLRVAPPLVTTVNQAEEIVRRLADGTHAFRSHPQ
jgi:acetylornithine/succinyldiaminopimelate/putrescine aminotransferase